MSETMAEEKPKDKSRGNRRKDKKDKTNQVIKIVMRHLPPTMTEADFLDQVGPLPENDTYYYCPADWSLGQEATCRAYIDMSMKDIADVLQFRDRFDGYVFVDTKGVEYVAIVEYAPFQCFLKNKARNDDSKVNTIESEPHYQEFIQRLADEREEASRMGDVKIDFCFDRRADEKVKSTPLLQYLANKKEKRREEARKRNEEKRKQREEQKQVRLAEQSDATKSKESAGAGGDTKKPAGNNANAKKDGKETPASAAQGNDAAKTSRSKRRTERDQRRREEHEKRKLAQRDKKKPEGQSQGKPEQDKPSGGKQNQKNTKSKADKDIVILKKENKPPEAKDSAQLPTTSRAAEDCQGKTTTENSEVTEAVKKFIQAAGGGAKDKGTSAKAQDTAAEEAIKAARFRDSEERRIRNKDRPSIAIYQPKARNRIGSDDLPQGTGKDCSDGEASVVEEKSAKKNKRSNRRNKSKPQEVKEENQDEARRVSKSSESSNSANSTKAVK
ncbi:regulator of nonsense transcripts 3B [Drosophila gunungcola]|uniref:regulator of nonsense transcripts 3B n=1 Tax=Drosophila gunungcola TaxID=103775 RepID=UPI0022E7CD85|nr:regulator of nonsense transcripts 3B [Drosophila gunungcola]